MLVNAEIWDQALPMKMLQKSIDDCSLFHIFQHHAVSPIRQWMCIFPNFCYVCRVPLYYPWWSSLVWPVDGLGPAWCHLLSIQASNVYYILLLSIVFAILAIHIFLHFNARSSLFSQVGLLLKFPVFLQKGRLGRFRMDTEKPLPWECGAALGQRTGVAGVSILGKFQGLVNSSPAVWPIQQKTSPIGAPSWSQWGSRRGQSLC